MNGRALPKSFTFAWLLAGLFLLVLLTAMSLIAVVSSYFTRRSVEELADRIVAQTLGRVELRISALLDQAMNQNAQGKLLLEGRQLSQEDFKLLGGFFAHSLEVLGDLSDLGFGRQTNGDYVFAERLPDGNVRVREYLVDESGARVIRDWRWRGAERELLKVAPWDGYDPRKRPFYQRAVAAGASAWTETYQFWHANERGPIPGVTFATPLLDHEGKLAGVLNSDFDLAALCRFLAEARQGMAGYAFVVERRLDGSFRLIAHPDLAMLPGDTKEQTLLSQLRDPKAAGFVQALLKLPDRRAFVVAGKNLIFSAEGKKYFGSTREMNGAGQPPWIIAVIIPVKEIMGGVYANDRRAFWLGLACLALTAWAAVLVARRVAEPLRHLTREARAIGRLDLTAGTEPRSRVEEVARLASSMSEMKSSLRSFQKFVPVDIVRQLVTTASEARLGGQRATLTMFFSDVADFTAMAEGMSPEALVAHVGQYLGEMSEVIQAGGGTVDKFIGDGIMAFWGAPRANPEHASAACATALRCQRALARLRERWRQAGKPELRARIGLHTGPAVVGNIGSETRLNYTAIGDSVNLTSRLEGLNKFYGTEILLSAACLEAAGDAILTRPVDSVSVKGRTEGIIVYELLAMKEEADEQTRRLARQTADAFAAYLRADFPQARELYQALRAFQAGDPVAALMAGRCAEYVSAPRPATWDTTFRMKEK